MRIVAIRGKNLASLEGEFEIDFTVEPLKSAGIFAITGSTGSGKSTLLDALCLALFDDTPRTNRASENNIQIADVKDKTINQRDSRNILRRGTNNGYAEVDFVSLGGEIFRSRWSVRRSRDKVDGALQSSDFKLVNLSANMEVQGRKTELLAKIVALIGLTFDQFTRTVLLAQGDFATFLKATQKEKAELLEKLTGTEIYSRISTAIYEKTKQSEQELNRIRERIKDIELLPDEEVLILTAEKQAIVQEISILDKDIERITNHIKWIEDEAVWRNSAVQAEQLLAEAQHTIEAAKSRYAFLAQIDSVQEIRDSFNELQTASRQLAEKKSSLAEHEKALETNHSLLKQSAGNISLFDERLLKLDEEMKAVEPQIKKARELDVQMANAKENLTGTEKEYKNVSDKKARLEKSVTATQTSIELAQKAISAIDLWYDQNRRYQQIVPRIDLIVTLLDDVSAAKRQETDNAKILAESKLLWEGETKRLDELAKEAERLNNLLPAEIVSLRAKLEEGKPCPVCGSAHHPLTAITQESLEEAELIRAKKKVADQTASLSAQIENRKKENIRLESVIERYSGRQKEAAGKLYTYLEPVPEWQTVFKQGNLPNYLKTMAHTWTQNALKKNNANEQIAGLQSSLTLIKDQLGDTEKERVAKEEKYANFKWVLMDLQKRRAALFDGKNADEAEQFYLQKRKEMAGTLLKLNEEKNRLGAVNKMHTGIIAQIAGEISTLSERCNSLQAIVEAWLSAESRNVSMAGLTELLLKDNAWIMAEREQLNCLQQNKTGAAATLKERREKLEKHASVESKPAEDERKDALQTNLREKQEAIRQKNARHTGIDVLFASHNRGKERIGLFEEELNEKSTLTENWRKLNEMFGSADGAKFKVLSQGYTLDALLMYANKRLQELSRRYEIQRIPDTLALQVVDLDMLGEVRTVHSLSGGESFLISLALALGLSSLSSNRMKIESLFIDEGFGSLDMDTLRVAMDALDKLQTQGRKIGVISHVAEMTERIHAQIHVEKLVNGKSRIKISGA